MAETDQEFVELGASGVEGTFRATRRAFERHWEKRGWSIVEQPADPPSGTAPHDNVPADDTGQGVKSDKQAREPRAGTAQETR